MLALTTDTSGRIHYETTACIAIMLYHATSELKQSTSYESTKPMERFLLQMVDCASESSVFQLLLECLTISGASLMSGSSNMVPAACEACKAIWCLINAVEIIFAKEQTYVFPLVYSRRQLSLQPDIMEYEQSLKLHKEPVKVITRLVKLFVESKAIQVAIYYSFHNGLESALYATLQVYHLSFSREKNLFSFHRKTSISMFLYHICTMTVILSIQYFIFLIGERFT